MGHFACAVLAFDDSIKHDGGLSIAHIARFIVIDHKNITLK